MLADRLQPADFYSDLPDTISLSDGGVRDNSGLTAILAGREPAGYEHDFYLIGSDAGALVNILEEPSGALARLWPLSWFRGIPRGRVRKVRYLRRQFDIMGHHNNRATVALALQVHRTRATSKKGMAMLRMDELIEERIEAVKDVSALIRVPTRLKYPGWRAANLLADHGSNLLWARLSEYTDLADHNPLSGISKRKHKDTDPRDEALAFVGHVVSSMQANGHATALQQAVEQATVTTGLSVRAADELARAGIRADQAAL